MKAWIWAAGLVAWSLLGLCPTQAQDGTASFEEKATASGEQPEAAPTDQTAPPRDPHKGAVTNLPIPRFVSLKGHEGNARRGPGLTHRIDWVFTRENMPLKVTAEYEHWRRVEDVDGAGGWVHYSLLSGVRTVLVTQDMAPAYANRDMTAGLVFQSERGVVGKLVQCIPDWCRVSIEGDKGWMQQTALWGVTVGETYP
ncbi:MAG: SH3 domain-containing protein [Pseudomonadota bacterium]